MSAIFCCDPCRPWFHIIILQAFFFKRREIKIIGWKHAGIPTRHWHNHFCACLYNGNDIIRRNCIKGFSFFFFFPGSTKFQPLCWFEKEHNIPVTLIDLPIPTICANSGSILQLKTFSLSSVIIENAYSFKYTLQCASPIRTIVNLSANLQEEPNDYFDLPLKKKPFLKILLDKYS